MKKRLMKISIRRIKAISKKEIRQLLRDVRMLGVIFLFPIFLLIVFGYAINFDVRHVKIAVYDLDKSSLSRSFIRELVSSEYFDLVNYIENKNQIEKFLDENIVQCVVVIPENFSRNVYSNKEVKIQYLIDGVQGNTANLIMNYVSVATANLSKNITEEFLARKGINYYIPIQLETRYWFNPDLNSTRFLLPGLIGMILILVAVVTISLSIVREKEKSTIEQLNVSSLSVIELLIGKIIPYVIIAFINASIILFAGYIFFDIIVKGSFFWLLICTLVFLSASLGMGIIVSVIADSMQVAFQIGTLISLLPSLLLSGFVFPIESMPVFIQIITNITPTKFYIICLRSILLKGAGIENYWQQLLYMILFSVISVSIAARAYIKKMS
ncbi:ABC transporter permease [Rosettibacter firmus]|uniref:ABC transporter permease n=1 Tax=Rosettibacter firmus TaxID=3111522 RepID=UPI00336BC377